MIANQEEILKNVHTLAFNRNPMQPEIIEALIKKGLHEADVYVEGDGTHFNALVICTAFAGKSRIQRQQLVYSTVRTELLNGTLHALSLKTLTPEEWQQLEEKGDV